MLAGPAAAQDGTLRARARAQSCSGPLASDALLAHCQVTLPRSERDDNRLARCASAAVLRASQVGPHDGPASESLVGVTVLRNEAVRASSQAGGSCSVD